MKIIAFILCGLCIIIELIMYVDFKKFIRTHREERIDQNLKGIKKRSILIFAVPVIMVLLMLIVRLFT